METAYKVTINNTSCTVFSMSDAIYIILDYIENNSIKGESIDIRYEEILMTEEEIENLPEFEGY